MKPSARDETTGDEPIPPAQEEPLAPEASVKSELPAFPIVGIGASVGGLEAYRQLLEALPSNTGMGFVLVQVRKLTRLVDDLLDVARRRR